MKKSVFPCVQWVVLLSLLSFTGCYSTVEVGDSPADKAISIDWVDPLCAEPGSPAGYIEGNGFGAENVTVTVGGIEAEVLAATGKDASFIVPAEGLSPGETIEVVVMNPGGRLATIQWVVCGFDCSAIDCDDGNECTTDTCDPSVEECVHTPVGDGVACDFDGLPGLCIDGACEEDLCTDVDCEDGDPCTVDGCNPLNGICSHVNTCGDGDPPVITDFDFNPKNVDVANGPATITQTISVTDSPAGVDFVQCYWESPSGAVSTTPISTTPSSGDRFNGVFECVQTIPQGAAPGVWTVFTLRLTDTVGNQAVYYTADLDALGFPTQLDVTSSGGGDGDPPVITDFDFNPKNVDVANGPATITQTISVTDSPAGVDFVQCYWESPSGAVSTTPISTTPSSGDRFNGVFECVQTIPQGAAPGVWTVFTLRLTDTVGNQAVYYTADLDALGFPTQLDVTSSGGGDGDPPVITDFDFNPKNVDVANGPATITQTISVTDSPAGVDFVQCYWESPSGAVSTTPISTTPSSGDRFNGVFECVQTIPQGAAPGVWTVFTLRLTDTVGNQAVYYTADLDALGFPTQLDVTYGGGSPP